MESLKNPAVIQKADQLTVIKPKTKDQKTCNHLPNFSGLIELIIHKSISSKRCRKIYISRITKAIPYDKNDTGQSEILMSQDSIRMSTL